MPDFPLPLRLLQEAELIPLGHRGIDAMQLIEIDAIEAQPAQAAIELLAKAIGTRVLLPLVRPGTIKAALGRDDEFRGIRIERLRDQLLADMRPVRFGGIDQRHVELDRAPQRRDRLGPVARRSPIPPR